MKHTEKWPKKVFLIILVLTVAVLIGFILIERAVVLRSDSKIVVEADSEDFAFSKEEKSLLETFDPECAIVLGAGIIDSETPSIMLKDRLDMGVALYKEKLVPKLLLSGDNGQIQHNEIHVMLNYCKDQGVDPKDIFCDHAGFSTYDSLYRSNSVFEVRRAVIVTQKYHLYRALYLADSMGVLAVGAASDQQQPYPGQVSREMREVLARIKDFFKKRRHPSPLLGGDKIPISGKDGSVSHGE